MANTPSELSTEDLLRMFLLKWLSQADVTAEKTTIGKFLDGTSGAIEVDTTVG